MAKKKELEENEEIEEKETDTEKEGDEIPGWASNFLNQMKKIVNPEVQEVKVPVPPKPEQVINPKQESEQESEQKTPLKKNFLDWFL
ncbi:hypothetical protein M1I50_19150 [Clostridioides difficile]|nr:hypothetical protein [Clostridioides difficile]MCL0945081.1 hypothetical protein [Clostridioides difficile]MCR1630766.1 hypothetical protein [Clostridioides difficile]MDI2847297.1 hypothetical protein [Clostridioides difficile]